MKKRIRSAITPFILLFYFLYAFFVCLSAFPPPRKVVAQAGSFAYIGNEAYFYATREENRGLFLLPKTYYVKVLSVDGAFCKIEYLYDDAYGKKLTGYAKTDALTFVDYTPAQPYLYHLFELRYTIEGAPTDSASLSQITVTCVYYGDYPIGAQTYAYILRGNEFGYIPKPSNLIYAENTEYAERTQNDSPTHTGGTPEQPASMSPLQIGVLIAVCLLVPTVVAAIVKAPRHTPFEQEE